MKRLADPYRDLDVIDSRAPRFNQATIGALSALAVATGRWWLLGILATASYAAGLAILGAALGGVVAALALLAATTGFCAGCEAYKLGSFLLGRPFVSCPLRARPATGSD